MQLISIKYKLHVSIEQTKNFKLLVNLHPMSSFSNVDLFLKLLRYDLFGVSQMSLSN